MRRFLSHRLALIGGFIICLLLFSAAFGPLLIPSHLGEFNPERRLEPPSLQHILGTDPAGRDILARIVIGSRISLTAAFIVISLSVIVGGTIGLLAGYAGGRLDYIAMRIADIFLSVPYLILAMAVAAILGPSIYSAMIGVAVSWWPVYARLIRAEALTVSRALYVEAAASLGLSRPRIMIRHVLPNCSGPLIVKASLDFGEAILSTAALSFIGVGAQPPSPEWGAMINSGRNFLREAWWVSTFPGLAIVVSVMAFNLVGDAIRDLLDPQSRMRG